jgi:hypothetical protein
MRFCTKSRKYSIVAPRLTYPVPVLIMLLLLLPSKGGDDWPRAGRDGVAPIPATVIE